ncbi:ABC transporter ATP-binding protein [Candidatus Similichlamydia laticola]|uniref:Spermidine/putrescine import ATP-binding protein PotA n=1 Tax=Candidatus Similichlamydia laticola TaxID=2170265 RepID=A0A369KF37_9BACT|nr:ABC transporter ATP-binding protein [Candidatus Similichlamydia laticola]RDB31507.1 Putrescine transport ATP-binding protein PotA [Candidatus Similichlamydia laticola]
MGAFLCLSNLKKHFNGACVVDIPELCVQRGEIFSILGPSGSGKTSLLRMIAGFESPDTGFIVLSSEDITRLPANKRKVNTIFQNYALFPHLTVWDNIAFGMQIQGYPLEKIREEVEAMLSLIQMNEHADKFPGEISGGQKQRVAIGRALIMKPQVLLLDEPLAALDLKLRQKMLLELDQIHDEVGITFLFVTHDQSEAMGISDRIAIMNKGKIEQVGTPAEIYEAPKNRFVAAFIGDTNFFKGQVLNSFSDDYLQVNVEELGQLVCYRDRQTPIGSSICLSVRPEKFYVSLERPNRSPLYNVISGIVEDIIYLGSHTKYWIRVGIHRLSVLRQHNHFLLDEQRISWKDQVWLSWSADDGYILESTKEERIS